MMNENPFESVYREDYFTLDELNQKLSIAHRQNPELFFKQFLNDTFIEVELEDALASFVNLSVENPIRAEDFLYGFENFLSNPPDNSIEYLFTNAGLRPYHNEDTPDEKPYSEAETLEFLKDLFVRMKGIFETNKP